MKTNLRLCLTLAAAVLAASELNSRTTARNICQTSPSNDGAIEGRVVDIDDRTVAGVSVYIVTLEHPLPAGPRPPSQTVTRSDDEGRFYIGSVTPGRYSIEYAKEEEGYPDTAHLHFLDPSAVPQVQVRENEVARGVEIHLGPKAARLIGKILDGKTLEPVENGQLWVYQATARTQYFSSQTTPEGRFELTMAPVSVTIKASASGYEDWYYYNRTEPAQSDTLQLAPDVTKEVTIHLRVRH
jgi:hypothetical protein